MFVITCHNHLLLLHNLQDLEGKYVRVEDTIKGFKEILEGKWDHLPEQAFHNVGSIEEAVAKAKTLTNDNI